MALVIRRGAAALLLAIVSACAGPVPAGEPPPIPASTPAPPAPTPAQPASSGWAQALDFSGDVSGAMYRVVAGGDATRSECSGRNSRTSGAWVSALFGPVGQDVYEVLVTVRPYRGPGRYRTPDVVVQVSRRDGSAVWQTSAPDSATFGVGADEESGSVDATLTNLANTTTELRLDGRWSCRT